MSIPVAAVAFDRFWARGRAQTFAPRRIGANHGRISGAIVGLGWAMLLLCFSVMAHAGETATQVQQKQLGNGMRIWVLEDSRAPVVTSQIWYRVGSADEPPGLTGISHLLEHLMFKGTETHASGYFSQRVASLGGRENAFTSRDYTAYFETVAPEHLPEMLELEADRMRKLRFDPDEVERERQVVIEERRLRTEDDPNARLYEQFNALAWQASPYRQPVIGWAGDIEAITLDDLKDWYRRFYAPNNATLVVVGAVQAGEVFREAERIFGPIPAEEIRRPRQPDEPPQQGERRAVVEAPARLPALILGLRAPALGEVGRNWTLADGSTHTVEAWEPYAVEVLAGILDGGASARLSRNLLRGQQVAAEAGAGFDAWTRLHGQLLLSGIPARVPAGTTDSGTPTALQRLETALWAELERLRHEPVSESELKRVKAQIMAADVFGRDSQFYQAMRLGQLATVGLPAEEADAYGQKLTAVNADQVREVAQRYLHRSALTVAELKPLPLEPGKGDPSQVGSTGGRMH